MTPSTPRHFVATGYVVKDGRTLLLYHKKLKMWLPPGGHLDDSELPEEAVLREILEETGLEAEIVSPRRLPDPSDGVVRYLHIPGHVQLEDIPGNPPHQHVDLIYFCRVKNGAPARDAEDHELRWCSPGDLASDPSIKEEVRVTGTQAIEYVAAMSGEPAASPAPRS